MHPVTFVKLPFAAKLSAFFTPFILWVMFAEFVIDRQGWHAALPFYKFGAFCPYDLAVLIVTAILWMRAEQVAKREREAAKPKPVARCC